MDKNLFVHIENGFVFAYGVLKDKDTLQTIVKREIEKNTPGKRERYTSLFVEEIHLEYSGGTDGRYVVSQPQVLVIGKPVSCGIRVLHIYNSPDGLWGKPIVLLEQTREEIPPFIFVSQEQIREDLSNEERKRKKLYALESAKGNFYPHSGTTRRVKKFVIEVDRYDSKSPALFVVTNRRGSLENPFDDSYREQEVGKDSSIVFLKAQQVCNRN